MSRRRQLPPSLRGPPPAAPALPDEPLYVTLWTSDKDERFWQLVAAARWEELEGDADDIRDMLVHFVPEYMSYDDVRARAPNLFA